MRGEKELRLRITISSFVGRKRDDFVVIALIALSPSHFYPHLQSSLDPKRVKVATKRKSREKRDKTITRRERVRLPADRDEGDEKGGRKDSLSLSRYPGLQQKDFTDQNHHQDDVDSRKREAQQKERQ